MHYWNPARLTGVGASLSRKKWNQISLLWTVGAWLGYVGQYLALVSAQLAGPVCPSWAEKFIHLCPQRSWATTASIYQAEVAGSSSSSSISLRDLTVHMKSRHAATPWLAAWATVKSSSCTRTRVVSSRCHRTRLRPISSSTALHALEEEHLQHFLKNSLKNSFWAPSKLLEVFFISPPTISLTMDL
jgi:hypothetical protein